MTVVFNQIVQTLSESGIENPRLEARILLSYVLNCSPDEIYSSRDIDEKTAIEVLGLVEKRLKHYPLDKIIGKRAFYKSDFIVDENVLSPRPDTEILVENALEYLKYMKSPKILDLGTGSGCIIESLLQEVPQLTGTAVDISAQALKVAEKNAARLGVQFRLQFLQADWFSSDFLDLFDDSFDMIVSNPPYIPTSDITNLSDEVKFHDPLISLNGGDDGLDSYRRIAEIAPQLLKEKGIILLEAGINQAEEICYIFSSRGFTHYKTVEDLAGIPRCVIMKK